MDASVVAFILAVIALYKGWTSSSRFTELQEELLRYRAEQEKQAAELQRLRTQLAALREAGLAAPPAPPTAPEPAPAPRPAVAPELLAPPAPVRPVAPRTIFKAFSAASAPLLVSMPLTA